MFRDLIPELADRYHVVAPDLPGFGQTKAPSRGEFTYSSDALVAHSGRRYAMCIFDSGAPIGASRGDETPARVTAIISQTIASVWRGSATSGGHGRV
jgi:pimeloyl-ACP methyl ester carboxylesterase